MAETSNNATPVVIHHLQAFNDDYFTKPNAEQLVKMLQETKSIIAGGFVMNCILGTHQANDIDIFCEEAQEVEWLKNYPTLKRVDPCQFYEYEQNLSGITAVYRSPEQLNLIVCKTLVGTLDGFDLDLCKASYDGYSFTNHQDVGSKKMTIIKPFEGTPKDVDTRMGRLTKYRLRGYTFTNLRQRLADYLTVMVERRATVTLSRTVVWNLISALEG